MIFRSFDGKRIFVHEWLDVENPRGFVQIVHGMTEHGARYEAFAKYLNANGYLVVADDHRGHGYTDPNTLGYSEGDNMFFDTVKDEASLTDYYKSCFPELPYFIFGFSYGSFLTQCYISWFGDKVDGAVIGGSNKKKDFEVYLGCFVARLGKKKKPAKLIEKLSFGKYASKFKDKEWLSCDAENNAAYRADAMCGFVCSNKFYLDFFRGLKSLYTEEYVGGLRKDLPLLLVSGEQDPVGDMGKGVKKLHDYYCAAGITDVEYKLFPESRHEFLNEKKNRDEKRLTVLEFFNKHCGKKQ